MGLTQPDKTVDGKRRVEKNALQARAALELVLFMRFLWAVINLVMPMSAASLKAKATSKLIPWPRHFLRALLKAASSVHVSENLPVFFDDFCGLCCM